MVAPRVRRR
jgi:hypothetical protein